jgi:uncharacterized protein YdcH (DUF465 family)
MDLHHPLVRELPEHRERIHHLRLGDDSFRQMYEEYHDLDDKICRFEEEVEFASDRELAELKARRAWLKDRLFAVVQTRPVAA